MHGPHRYTNWEFGNNRELDTGGFIELDDLARSGWDPAVPTEYGSFEDGNLVYPGKHGPVLSIRLANWRDGAEDHALLSLLKARDPPAARAIAEQLVTNSTWHVGEYAVMDRARRAVAAALLENFASIQH